MALKKMGLAIVKNLQTGIAELATQFFEGVEDIRTRYPKDKFKILAFPVKFDMNGKFDFDPEDDTDIGD